ncbi:hypothetical protein EB796_000401 [Bugula neritina]|uniref:CTCK domain-containing protein n=1 Tax=Bugula neritina TaxID=10212 RepID=A0A7J7KSY0_BUGNE|nr:hypothetical protein EB796_000401 [Bugula neritina]
MSDQYGSVKPTECHPVPVFERVTRDNCRSKYHVDLRQCQGSCGDEIGDCCVPDKNSTISVVTNCKEDGYSRPLRWKELRVASVNPGRRANRLLFLCHRSFYNGVT